MSRYEPLGCFGLVLPAMFPSMSSCTGVETRTVGLPVPNKGVTVGPRYKADPGPWSDVEKDSSRCFKPLLPWPATLAPVLRDIDVPLEGIGSKSKLQRMVKISLGLGALLQEGIY